MGVYKDLTGLKINRWTVISLSDPYKSPSGRLYVMWKCLCNCGSIRILRTSSITSASTKTTSCGCFSAESTKKRATTHGMSHTPTYISYRAMLKRCSNVNDPHYKNYGGRGIKVCDRWVSSFENFLEDMGERPKGCSIDRIDNNKGYSQSNCKWSTKSEQQLNRRKFGRTSKYRGVHFCNHYNKFIAQIYIKNEGRTKKIGSFDKEYDAGLAYDMFVIKNNLPNLINNISTQDHKLENREKDGGKKF